MVGGCQSMDEPEKPAATTQPIASGDAAPMALPASHTTPMPVTPTTLPVVTPRKGNAVAGIYDVRAFGATGTGQTIDTPAINRAIEVAAAAGGGTVRFPAGTYLCYSIRLKDNITLYLDHGARILAANRLLHGGEGYDAPEDIGDTQRYQDFGHSHWHNSLIWGENLTNITITGPGLIDGGLYQTPVGTVGGLSRGTDQGLGGGRGGRGRGGATQPATLPDGQGFARGRGGAGRGGFGGGGGGRGSDPFAAALAQVRGRGANQPAADGAAPAPDGAGAAPAGGGFGGGRGGRPNTLFATDLSRPFTSGDMLPAGIGNKSISLKLCKNVTLSDFSVVHGGHFALLATGVDNLTIDNLKIDTNRDGFDIDGCRNVRVSNCSINSPQDDAIVLKSSWGLGYARDCDNVTITNCLVCGGWEVGSMLDATYKERAPGTGRIKFGTESNGGFKNITISNCVFDRCQGLALEAVDGAVIDNISISNITMREIGSLPIFIRLGNRARMPADKVAVGAIRHVNISDIVAQNRAPQYACEIVGIPGHPIEDVRISNVRIIWPGGAPEGIEQVVPPENEFQYPEPGMFGVMPTYGFFIRHVKGIELNNIEMSYNNKDMRPPFWLQDVNVAEFNHIKAQREAGVPLFMLKDVEAFRTHEVRGMADTFKEKVEQEKF
jgi:polygalacturonase